MAGPLDFLNNMTPEQNQALLAAGSQILLRAAPGRQPFSFGQAMGVGGLAFQDSMAEQQARAAHMRQSGQLEQMRGLQIEGMESDLEAQRLARQRAQEYQALVKSYQLTRGAGQAASAAPQDRSGAAMFSGLMNGSAPTISAPGEQQGMGSPVGAPTDARSALVQEGLQFAKYLSDNGYRSEAQAAAAEAMKLQPKVKEWQKVTAGGKTMYAPYFEDGTYGQPVPLQVAQALERVNTGGSTELIDPVTGETVRSLKSSLSPGEAASSALGWANHGLSKQRLEIERAEAATRAAIGRAPTEFQGKAGQFALRMGDADQTIRELDGKYSPAAINAKANVEDWPLIGGALGALTNKFALSESDQKAEQAQRDWVNANLRQESGAAIGADEFSNARRQYFPQPGDSQAVIDQKARNRRLAEQGMRANAGRAALTAPPRGAANGGITFLGFE